MDYAILCASITTNWYVSLEVNQGFLGIFAILGASYDFYDSHQPTDKISAENKKVALLKRPQVLEYFGYMYFPASFIVGPQFPLKRYQNYLNGEFSDKVRKIYAVFLPICPNYFYL